MLLPITSGALQARQDPPPGDSGDARKANVIIAVGNDLEELWARAFADTGYRS